jgi:hypothetical protein
MDKRWKNLVFLLIGLVILVLVYFLVSSFFIPESKESLMQKAEDSIGLMKQNDVNYVDFKVALETFSYSLDPLVLDTIYLEAINSNNSSLVELIEIERRQNEVVEDYFLLTSYDFPNVCEELPKTDKILDDAFLVMEEMDSILLKSNPLLIDSNILYESYREMEADITELTLKCNNAISDLEGFE